MTKSHFYVGLSFNKNMKREYIQISVTKIKRRKGGNIIDGER